MLMANITTRIDKGGDPQQFHAFYAAAEVLLDPGKRAIYDKEGLAGLAHTRRFGPPGRDSTTPPFAFSPNLSTEEIYKHFFRRNSNQQFTNPTTAPRGESITYPLKVSLADLYFGKELKVAVKRQRPCMANAHSQGGLKSIGGEQSFVRCEDCHGTGLKQTVKQMGVGIVNHVNSTCVICNGSGRCPGTGKCRVCNGTNAIISRCILPVRIERGHMNRGKIKFVGEGGLPTQEHVPGDVTVVLKQVPHDLYTRLGNDLQTTIHISLHESLCGYDRTLPHIDGRMLRLKSEEGVVTKPNSVYVLEGNGMPVPGTNATQWGRLFVTFDVVSSRTALRGMYSRNYVKQSLQVMLRLTRVRCPLATMTMMMSMMMTMMTTISMSVLVMVWSRRASPLVL